MPALVAAGFRKQVAAGAAGCLVLGAPLAAALARHWLLATRHPRAIELFNCHRAIELLNCIPVPANNRLARTWLLATRHPPAGWRVLANNLIARSWLLATIELPLQMSGFLFGCYLNFECAVDRCLCSTAPLHCPSPLARCIFLRESKGHGLRMDDGSRGNGCRSSTKSRACSNYNLEFQMAAA